MKRQRENKNQIIDDSYVDRFWDYLKTNVLDVLFHYPLVISNVPEKTLKISKIRRNKISIADSAQFSDQKKGNFNDKIAKYFEEITKKYSFFFGGNYKRISVWLNAYTVYHKSSLIITPFIIFDQGTEARTSDRLTIEKIMTNWRKNLTNLLPINYIFNVIYPYILTNPPLKNLTFDQGTLLTYSIYGTKYSRLINILNFVFNIKPFQYDSKTMNIYCSLLLTPLPNEIVDHIMSLLLMKMALEIRCPKH